MKKNKNKANKRYGCENTIIATTSILMTLNFLQAMKDLKVRAQETHENLQVREILEFGKQTFPSMQIVFDRFGSIARWKITNSKQQIQQLSAKLPSFNEFLDKKSVELLKISELCGVIVTSEFQNNQWSFHSI
ncbi:hypothetical protein RFI_27488 [Reticulomyxa filosa]|uniref:Uncharacterized protein n=1 Tax=Reticulomyxa filosa TaxID=46433 RepID=X6M8F3_RETFI|nr:hypothetical protein RFI_27488 [Reticulomyxa filosa]|eukprot:ETO09891.1 hypothetical protein RFI_27488 [Reticulomyxa filosa]